MGRDRKSETHVHTTRVALDRRIEELLHLRESDNLVEFLSNLGSAHAEDGTIQKNVLATAKFGVEASSDLEETCDPALDLNTAGARLRNAGKYFQQRRFARTVATDNANGFASPYLEVQTLNSPELLDFIASDELAAPYHVPCRACEAFHCLGDDVAQRDIRLALGLMADQVFLAKTFGADDDVAHALTPYLRTSVRLRGNTGCRTREKRRRRLGS